MSLATVVNHFRKLTGGTFEDKRSRDQRSWIQVFRFDRFSDTLVVAQPSDDILAANDVLEELLKICRCPGIAVMVGVEVLRLEDNVDSLLRSPGLIPRLGLREQVLNLPAVSEVRSVTSSGEYRDSDLLRIICGSKILLLELQVHDLEQLRVGEVLKLERILYRKATRQSGIDVLRGTGEVWLRYDCF